MYIRKIYITICLVFGSIAMHGATSISEVAHQFLMNKIDVDSLFNYLTDDSHVGEGYSWAINNSEKNDPMANFILGRCYLGGIGTKEDMPKAKGYFEKAINLGVDEALVDLGRMYVFGWGVEKNKVKGIQLLNQAANKNRPRGIYNLGRIHMDNKDYQKAYPLIKKAADAGYSVACVDLGWLYENGQGVERDLTKAFEYYLKGVKKGNSIGLCNVGIFYEYGKGVGMDQEKAFAYYFASAEKKNPRGAYKVGYFYQYKDTPEGNSYWKAAKWYKIAAQDNFKPAIVELAVLMYDGTGVKQNRAKAIEMLESVGENNIGPWSACKIADYYMELDPVTALKWAKFAYDKADDYVCTVESCKLLGTLYLKGGESVYDYDLAVKYLRIGAELDQPDCIRLLQSLGEPIVTSVPTISPSVRKK